MPNDTRNGQWHRRDGLSSARTRAIFPGCGSALAALGVLAGACGAPAGGGAGAVEPTASAEALRYTERTANAVFSVHGIHFETPNGEPVENVMVELDGSKVGECSVPDTPGDVCFDELRIAPGPHTVDIYVGCRDPETNSPFNCGYNVWDRFVVAPRERLSFDVAASFAHEDDPAQYLDREAGPEAEAPDCIRALERLAYAPACNVEQLRDAETAVEEARDECDDDTFSGGWRSVARSLLLDALNALYAPAFPTCYAGNELRRLETTGGVPDGINRVWIRPLDQSTWTWARDVLPADVEDDAAPEALLAALSAGLPEAKARVGVVDALIAAFRDPEQVPELRRRALAEPFSFDPRTAAGQIHWWIVDAEMHDVEYDRQLAVGVGQDESLDCGDYDQIEELLPYFLDDDALTEEEWQAVTALIERTPATDFLGRCDHVFGANVQAPLPLLDRLRWLARWDCSEDRHERVRGDALESCTREGDWPSAPAADVIRTIREEFPDCVPMVP